MSPTDCQCVWGHSFIITVRQHPCQWSVPPTTPAAYAWRREQASELSCSSKQIYTNLSKFLCLSCQLSDQWHGMQHEQINKGKHHLLKLFFDQTPHLLGRPPATGHRRPVARLSLYPDQKGFSWYLHNCICILVAQDHSDSKQQGMLPTASVINTSHKLTTKQKKNLEFISCPSELGTHYSLIHVCFADVHCHSFRILCGLWPLDDTHSASALQGLLSADDPAS